MRFPISLLWLSFKGVLRCLYITLAFSLFTLGFLTLTFRLLRWGLRFGCWFKRATLVLHLAIWFWVTLVRSMSLDTRFQGCGFKTFWMASVRFLCLLLTGFWPLVRCYSVGFWSGVSTHFGGKSGYSKLF